MYKKSIIIGLFLSFLGCKDIPYEEPTPKPLAQQSNFNFKGMVELGSPVIGTNISAYKFSGLKKGEKITEAISNRDGTYELNFQTNYDGPILLVATGGLYKDIITGENIALKPSNELSSVITHISMPEKANINAFTTLAVARVFADRGFWNNGIAQLKDIDRINVDFAHISYFISGKSGSFVNIRKLDNFDSENDPFKIDDPRAKLHLAHAGLSKLANDFSEKLAESGIIISLADLVTALSEDLSDRVFDGFNAKGNRVFLGDNHRIILSSHTMRKYFSESIMLYSRSLHGSGKIEKEDERFLEEKGQIINSIATETQPELFPINEKPMPIDNEAPELKIHFAGEHKLERPFAFLMGNVVFDIEAFDDSKIQEIKMLEPKTLGIKTKNNYGPIFVNEVPQAMQAAEACEKKNYLLEEIKKREMKQEDLICACFEATDIFNNSTKELSCFRRLSPTAIIDFPSNKTVLSSKSFNEGVHIKARVSGGLPLTSCSWRIQARLQGEIEDGILPNGQGEIEGTKCTIDEPIDGSNFLNGNYYLIVEAEDLGGRFLKTQDNGIYQSAVNFQVFKEPPQVEILSPSNNGYLAKDYIPVFGTISDPGRIKEISVTLRGIDENTESLKTSSLVPIDINDNKWSVGIGENLADGEYVFDVWVKDIFGNEKRLPSRKIEIDHKAPTILGPLEGVPQEPYVQETLNYRQRFIDEPENPHYLIEPLGEAAPISWRSTPKISRYLTRLDDMSSAPSYTVKISDDHKIKEVRYSINYKCDDLEDSSKIAKNYYSDGRYTIGITQSGASFDLSRDSTVDGHTQKYCLSIWAIDQAGNAKNHSVEFIWKVVVPPLSIDMNSNKYKAYLKNDDLSSINRSMGSLFNNYVSPMSLKGDLVIGHAILSNPFSEPLSAKLILEKPLDLILTCGKYKIPEKYVDILYYSYDLSKNELGPERFLYDSSVVLNANEVVLAKFVLTKNIPITDVSNPKAEFWQDFTLEMKFNRLEKKISIVDGLKLVTRDPYDGKIANEFPVPWGDDHNIRRRIPAKFGA